MITGHSGSDAVDGGTGIAQQSFRVWKVALALVFCVLVSTRAALFRLVRQPMKPPFVVLMYHSVKRHEREQFARQMDHLMSVGTAVAADFEQAADGRRYIAVTFDDGYLSVLENAWPILHDRRIPATVFAPTQYLGLKPGWIRDEGHRDAQERVLTADELREIRRLGGVIGSHGVSHRPLPRLAPAEALAELTESRTNLENLLGERISLFALPYGAASSDVLRLALDAGYRRVFLSVPRHADTAMARAHIGRVYVTPTDWSLEFHLKVRGYYQWLPSAIAAKGRFKSILRALSPGSLRRVG
jgi:peptidoglycan/xylan/chitin deacetylase (PgdA/CDA1 family)